MSDERRSEGSGAVVAIVAILGILFLLGVVVLFGGAFLFVARSGPADIQMSPVPTVAAPVQNNPNEPAADLDKAGVEVETTDTAVK